MASIDRRIAIVGMAFRFPGADRPDAYWHLISKGETPIRRFTDCELAAAEVPREVRQDPEFVAASGLLSRIDDFDAEFFGMTAAEAATTDPQHRMFMECCHHALEDAGHVGETNFADGRRIGVFASSGHHLYPFQTYFQNNVSYDMHTDGWVGGAQRLIGNFPDFIATRVAFKLGLTGPALGVQNACSSSLGAVHLAVQSLITRDSDIAVAGASAVHVPEVLGYRWVKGSILSRNGRCRAFDAASDGVVGGSGVAAVVLRRLEDAVADGDRIHGVILGVGVTNDGASKRNFTEPSAIGQREAVSRALAMAGVPAHTIGYVEAHGTGTYKGDPIEFSALTAAFREHTDGVGFCGIGSVKANIGHLDVCSGLAGLIKAVLVLKHGTIPPLAGFTAPNPGLDVASSPFYLPAEVRPWPAWDGPRRAGVTSLGMGGTNVHVVIEQAPSRSARRGAPVAGDARVSQLAGPMAPSLAPVSGASQAALRANAQALRDHLRTRPDTHLADLVTTLGLGRRQLRCRLVAYGRTPAAIVEALNAYLIESPPAPGAGGGIRVSRVSSAAGYACGTAPKPPEAPRVGWVCSGQGGARAGMANALYHRFPVVQATLDACEEQFRDEHGRSLLKALLDPAAKEWSGPAQPTDTAQPALFGLHVAQARLWRQLLGDEPAACAGHSVGEYAALCAAGALSLEDGLRLTAARGQLMERHMAAGGMLSAFTDLATAQDVLAVIPDLELAVVNGVRHHVLAGPEAAVAAGSRHLDRQGTAWRQLPVARAFHTSMINSILDQLAAACADVTFRPTRVPFVSGLDGQVRPVGWTPDSAYLLAHASQPVRFDQVLRGLEGVGCQALLEIGPGGAVSGLAQREVPHLPALRTQASGSELDVLWQTVAALHSLGCSLDWEELVAGCGGRRISLPAYQFQRKSHWTGRRLTPLEPVRSQGPEAGRLENGSVGQNGKKEASVDLTVRRIVELTAKHLGLSEDEVGQDGSFFDLGADSLQMINIVRELEREFRVKIAMRELFEQASSPGLLAALIVDRSEARGSTPPAAPAAPSAAPEATSGPAPNGVAAAVSSVPPAAVPAAPPAAPAYGPYATREAVEELAQQVRQLAHTQVQLMAQLSQLLTRQLAADQGVDQ